MVDQQDPPAVPMQDRRIPVPGREFAGHLVEALIGRGGMGVVYRARHRGLGRLVALKVILPDLLEDDTTKRRFLLEAVTAASFEHPNVVPVHDAGEADGIAYMVMRYVQGVDLGALVRGLGPLRPRRAAEVVAGIGGALDAMHREGYVHRDVKPRNVLMASSGHVYLSDFGLARWIAAEDGVTLTGHWCGTADYAAPEQIRGLTACAPADIYGLGCLLHFALTGRVPFPRDTIEAKLWAHMCEPPEPASRLRAGVPAAMDEVIARALAKDPADRFRSAVDLGRAALEAAGASAPAPFEPVLDRPAGAGDPRLAEMATVTTGVSLR